MALWKESAPAVRGNPAQAPPASGSVSALKNFKFGFNQLHGPARKVWYEDVAVAPTRIKCL
jgi:hypothetical protein